MQSFLSTSKNREIALCFVKQMVLPVTLNPVLFEITADTKLKERPFADITRHSEFPGEEEILFSVGCVFKATSVIYSDSVWLIKLVLCKTDENELNDVYSTTKAALDASIDLNTFSSFLWHTGMHGWIPTELPPKQQQLDLNNSKSVCLYADKVYRSGGFGSGAAADKWYLRAIDLELKSQPINYLNLFKMYLKVSTCLKDDKIYYQKAKDIVSNLTKENDPLQTARLYFKLAQHWNPAYHIDLNEALDCYHACLHIQEETLPENDLNIALTCNMIAELHFKHFGSIADTKLDASLHNVYLSIQEFFVRKCLSIQLKVLPATHIELAFTYVRLGRLYIGTFQRNTALALENYEKALNIFQALGIEGTRICGAALRVINDIKSGYHTAPDGCW
ncbi:unnamed protein product [Rotaria magnacalcarata]|nr:unnamed protein product [Rotaria magnacalcarata]